MRQLVVAIVAALIASIVFLGAGSVIQALAAFVAAML